ncbi:MAG TPA: protein translocase subunit SecD [Gammaproteobacteria bacterium]|nr:protein translocase subunit SecD [Gammaproteobacteria bacterium]
MITNRYPLWKYLLILAIVALGFIYALPNIYGDYPAVQITGGNAAIAVDEQTIATTKTALQQAQISYQKLEKEGPYLMLQFSSTDAQLRAKEILQAALGDNYLVAINLEPAIPNWLKMLQAVPMKLGLDLRGGVHFLLQVDVDSVLQQRVEGDLHNITQSLRDARIRYNGVTRRGSHELILQFHEAEALERAATVLAQHYPAFTWTKSAEAEQLQLQGFLSQASLYQEKRDILDQAMNILRNRVNELGISEAVVQQQGESRVSVDLPGIQDTAQAKNILGKTATLEFHLVDDANNAFAAQNGALPPGDHLYLFNEQPILLKNQVVLRGSSIVSASSSVSEDGRPSVNVRLSGEGQGLFTKITAENVGHPMAVVYVEVKSKSEAVNGKTEITYQTTRQIISAPVIQSALGSNFQVTGLRSPDEARNLALLLRAGALPAPVTIIEERQVGPSLGKQNIRMGVLSVEVGMALVIGFMALYYGVMGLIADLALLLNLVLIVAVLSILGATLTLPGIAGIVLTMGMAVDANVLIFERIREELRNGMSTQASIFAGYEKAFVTILDANLTTLIVAMVLFGLGSGVVKGVAVTLTIGLITSMLTAITGTRALVNLLYGRRSVKRISIGI